MTYRKSRFITIKKTFFRLLGIAFLLLMANLFFLMQQTPWLADMRSIELLVIDEDKVITKTTQGTIIANYDEFKIDYVSLETIPREVQQVFLAIEDYRFYQHKGVDGWAILRASWSILSDGQIQGGSTITQQLARNLFLSHDRTLKRKLEELIIAIQLERQFSKDEILEMYLNQIHFGKSYYGITRAAKGYFNKNIDELTLGELAILAGMPKGPNIFYPTIENNERALARQQVVLNRLADLRLISQQDAKEATAYLALLLKEP